MDVDPRSAQRAQNLMADAMQQVADLRLRHGVDHHQAREQVLRQDTAAWVEHAGKEVADAAVRGLHMLSPAEYLTARERRVLRAREKTQRREVLAFVKARQAGRDAEYRAYLEQHAPHLVAEMFPPMRGRLPMVIAMAIAALVLAVGGLLVFAASAHAGQPSPRWKALAACGVVKMDTPDYERRCRAFSRTERTVVRSYDGPGAGAPRDWEMPKAWD
jgi:hypothetical protein